MNKALGIAAFKPLFKKKIKTARAERNEAAAEAAAIDLSGFEAFLSSEGK
jgi:hypothetical protein